MYGLAFSYIYYNYWLVSVKVVRKKRKKKILDCIECHVLHEEINLIAIYEFHHKIKFPFFSKFIKYLRFFNLIRSDIDFYLVKKQNSHFLIISYSKMSLNAEKLLQILFYLLNC